MICVVLKEAVVVEVVVVVVVVVVGGKRFRGWMPIFDVSEFVVVVLVVGMIREPMFGRGRACC